MADLPAAVSALLARCLEVVQDAAGRALLGGSAASYARAWREHFSVEHDPSRVLGERNAFRYRPCRRVLVRAAAHTPQGARALAQVLLAARTCGVPVALSLPPGSTSWPWLADEGIEARVEDETVLAWRLADAERLRALVPVSPALREAAHRTGVAVLDAEPLATGRLELRWYLREQAVAHVLHRYGNVVAPPPAA